MPRPYRTNLIYPGAVFGRLTVIEKLLPHVFPSGGTAPRWSCRCECGNVVVVLNVSLLSKNTASCGCFMRENNGRLMAIRKTTHGEANRTPEYEAWSKSKDRCHNPKSKNWSNYGRRGIVMSERWRNSYETFLADVGRRPSSKHSFDRYPDNDGNYEPGNVRWATKQEQARNRRTNKHYEFNGETLTSWEWEARTGVPSETINDRILKGWSVERALTTPYVPR